MKSMIIILFLLGAARADIFSLVDTNLEPDLSASPCQLIDVDVAKLDGNIKHVLVHGLPAQDKFVLAATQLLSRLGYRVCTIASATATAATSTSSGVPADSVTILANGRRVIYHGKRDAPSLLRYVQQTELRLTSAPYEVIATKLDKKAYDHVNVPKVVGYFADDVNAAEFRAFVEAAAQLAPMTPCYVVHDPALATKLRFTQPNQVILVRRLEKSTIYFQPTTTATTTSWTAADLVAWVSSNHGLVLHVLDDTNLYDPEIHNPGHYQLVGVGDRNSPLGLYFYKMLTKSIQNISRHNELQLSPSPVQDEVNGQSTTTTPIEPTVTPALIPLDDIKVVWIDLGKYPSARAKVEALVGNQMIGATTNKEVWFGLMSRPAAVMSTTTAKGPVWFDMSLLNTTTGDRQAYDQNILVLRDWILEVTNRVPVAAAADAQPINSATAQSFVLEPEPVNVRQGSSFVLDCKVAHKQGECSWTRNAQPVSITTATGGAYQWAGVAEEGDCSLMVKSADKVRDSGDWACHVSGVGREQITSRSVLVNVRGTGSTEL